MPTLCHGVRLVRLIVYIDVIYSLLSGAGMSNPFRIMAMKV
jgi:hypothetical protein